MKKINYIKNNIKQIFTLAIISILTLSGSVSYANETEKLKSGIYELKNEIYHESEIGMSMARSYTADSMDLEYTKDKKAYTVTFTGNDYMENYRVLVNDKPIDFEIIEDNNEESNIKLKFEVSDINDKITAQIYVGPMERDVEFEVKPLIETLNLVEEIEEVEKEVSYEESNQSTEEEVNNSSEKSSMLPIVIGAVAVIAIAAFLIGKKK